LRADLPTITRATNSVSYVRDEKYEGGGMLDRSLDVVAVIIVSAVALALALLGLDSGVVPILLGGPLALVLPGYACVALFAPSKLSIAKRLLLSLLLSLLLTALGWWLLPQTPWGTQIKSWAVWLGSITLGAALIAFIRDHVRTRYVSPRPAALRSLAVCVLASALFTALVVARTDTTELTSAALLERWLAPSEQATPVPSTSDVALGVSSPRATASATATATLPPTTATAPPVSTTAVAVNTSTEAPVPTETPMPTEAPVPTETPVPTQEPAPTASDALVAERLPIELSDWPTRESDTTSMRYEADQYQLALNGQPNVSVASVIPVDSYRLSIDIALAAGEAGVIFLAVEPSSFLRIMFNTEGEYALQEVQQNSTDVALLEEWTASTALEGTEPIRVQIERQGNTIRFFANDQPLTTFDVPNGDVTNQAGVALATASEQGRATFTALVVEQLGR
jgi:hypothetical protein